MKHVWTGEECTVGHNSLANPLGAKEENFQCWTCANCGPLVPYDERDKECSETMTFDKENKKWLKVILPPDNKT